jgi:serine/threonine protein kinase
MRRSPAFSAKLLETRHHGGVKETVLGVMDDSLQCFGEVPEYHDPVDLDTGPVELKAGFVLDGRFEIIEALSRGGMATLYKARDHEGDGVLVVIKMPHRRFESDPAYFERFLREEEVGLKLRHPSIVRFVPVTGRKSRPYLVTEYVKGCTLAHLMKATRPVPERDALKIASALCAAVGSLHETGVVHRDLKPGNIMICTDRRMRLLDFGLAQMHGFRRITVVGGARVIGTPEYMSPEQVRNARFDHRTDIYSIGVILYEMLTGTIPFANENAWVAMSDRVTGDPPAPRSVQPEISPEAEEIVLRAMRRNPVDRYADAAAMKADLDSPASVRLTGLSRSLRKPTWRMSLEGTPVIAGVSIAAGFIAVQTALFLFLRHHFSGH